MKAHCHDQPPTFTFTLFGFDSQTEEAFREFVWCERFDTFASSVTLRLMLMHFSWRLLLLLTGNTMAPIDTLYVVSMCLNAVGLGGAWAALGAPTWKQTRSLMGLALVLFNGAIVAILLPMLHRDTLTTQASVIMSAMHFYPLVCWQAPILFGLVASMSAILCSWSSPHVNGALLSQLILQSLVANALNIAYEQARRSSFLTQRRASHFRDQALALDRANAEAEAQNALLEQKILGKVLALDRVKAEAATQHALLEQRLLESSLTNTQLICAKLQIETKHRAGSQAHAVQVQRKPLIHDAWRPAPSAPCRPPSEHELDKAFAADISPSLPCLAVTSADGVKLNARALGGTGLGAANPITAGSHPFVKLAGEGFLRVGRTAFAFGEACGHPTLAKETPVLYAGEIEVDEDDNLTRWNNVSGTYKCPDAMCFQAGLPLDTFYAVVENEASIAKEGGLQCSRILEFDDKEFERTQQAWSGFLSNLISSNEDSRTCRAKLDSMIEQRQHAVDKYGYLSSIARDLGTSPGPHLQ